MVINFNGSAVCGGITSEVGDPKGKGVTHFVGRLDEKSLFSQPLRL